MFIKLQFFLALVHLTQWVLAEEPCVVKEFSKVENATSTCNSIILDSLVVPGGKQLEINLKDGTILYFRGTTMFEFSEWAGPLVLVTGTNITVTGEKDSVLDGQGSLWWDGQGTWGNVTKPKFFRIKAKDSLFQNINLKNCPVGCVSVSSSENVIVRNWRIDNLSGDEGVAPPNKFGHNTDGFGISGSYNITLEDSVVYNQDDCVVFNSGKNITVKNLFCHGSHGYSLSVSGKTVEDVLVENSIITMAENGIHVKTHVDGGTGLIKNVMFKDIIILDSKDFGINVQQNYKNLPAGEPQDGPPDNNIPIHNLTMKNIFGNVLNGAVPVYVLCAIDGCFDWKWENVILYGAVKNNCTNYGPDGYNC
ncbi:hypothetical protein ABEB36_004432 [Hypothenemus hampei]|uniref:endo-polygalacturonase n=1 Tax=Hypothenemus hampei TaxID=57062 RepID=A0ABD1F4V1_HYPHA